MNTTVECGPNQKYCRDCGNAILEQAEICPGCGCKQIGVASVENKEEAELISSTPIREDIYAGAIFNVAAFFILHLYFLVTSMLSAPIGMLCVDLLRCLGVGTLIGTAIWIGTGRLVSSIGAKEPKVLLIARCIIQGILVVPIAAYLEPWYLRAEVSTGMVMLLALTGGGYACGLLYLASRKVVRISSNKG